MLFVTKNAVNFSPIISFLNLHCLLPSSVPAQYISSSKFKSPNTIHHRLICSSDYLPSVLESCLSHWLSLSWDVDLINTIICNSDGKRKKSCSHIVTIPFTRQVNWGNVITTTGCFTVGIYPSFHLTEAYIHHHDPYHLPYLHVSSLPLPSYLYIFPLSFQMLPLATTVSGQTQYTNNIKKYLIYLYTLLVVK